MKKVKWDDMLRHEFEAAVAECPVCYLPFGTLERHGSHLPFGQDGQKAHGLCIRAAEKHGGVVAPPLHWGTHGNVFQEDFDLARTAGDLNRLVHQNTDPGKFVTFFMAEVDKDTHRVRYVRAGHDEPIVVSADGSDRKLEVGDFVLGFVPEADFEVGETELAPGDVLCLYTDGVTEARNPEDEEFELSGIIEIVKNHRGESAEAIGRACAA